MNNIIIFFMLGAALSSFAHESSKVKRMPNSLTSLEEASLTYNQFLECHDEKNTSNIAKCVQKTVSENISPKLNKKISFWLTQVKLDKTLEDCPEKKLALFPHSSNLEYKVIKCFNFKRGKLNNKAVIYFLEEVGQMKIDGIQFF